MIACYLSMKMIVVEWNAGREGCRFRCADGVRQIACVSGLEKTKLASFQLVWSDCCLLPLRAEHMRVDWVMTSRDLSSIAERASCRRQFQGSPRPPALASFVTHTLPSCAHSSPGAERPRRSPYRFCSSRPPARKLRFARQTPSSTLTTTPPIPRLGWPGGRGRNGEPATADHRHHLLYEEEAPPRERLYALCPAATLIVLQLTLAADLDEADSPFATRRQDLKRKSQYARASDPDFLTDPRPYKKVRLLPLRRLGTD